MYIYNGILVEVMVLRKRICYPQLYRSARFYSNNSKYFELFK